jgi:hypothetical protein
MPKEGYEHNNPHRLLYMKCAREWMKSLGFEDVCGARRSSYAGCRSARALLTFATRIDFARPKKLRILISNPGQIELITRLVHAAPVWDVRKHGYV